MPNLNLALFFNLLIRKISGFLKLKISNFHPFRNHFNHNLDVIYFPSFDAMHHLEHFLIISVVSMDNNSCRHRDDITWHFFKFHNYWHIFKKTKIQFYYYTCDYCLVLINFQEGGSKNPTKGNFVTMEQLEQTARNN